MDEGSNSTLTNGTSLSTYNQEKDKATQTSSTSSKVVAIRRGCKTANLFVFFFNEAHKFGRCLARNFGRVIDSFVIPSVIPGLSNGFIIPWETPEEPMGYQGVFMASHGGVVVSNCRTCVHATVMRLASVSRTKLSNGGVGSQASH